MAVQRKVLDSDATRAHALAFAHTNAGKFGFADLAVALGAYLRASAYAYELAPVDVDEIIAVVRRAKQSRRKLRARGRYYFMVSHAPQETHR